MLDLLQNSFDLIVRLVGLSLMVQVIEVLRFKNMWNGAEVYRSNFWLFKKDVFQSLLFLQLMVCCSLIFLGPSPLVILALILNTVIYFRFRGVVNGGSDYMTALVLAACSIKILFSNSSYVGMLSLLYIGVQVMLSYFISGIVKIKNPQFRNGSALQAFLTASNYNVPSWVTDLAKSRGLMLVLSWVILIFELSAPLAITSSKFAVAYMGIAAIFHLANFLVFGLNRFFFAWIAAYPAFYFLAVYVSSKLAQ